MPSSQRSTVQCQINDCGVQGHPSLKMTSERRKRFIGGITCCESAALTVVQACFLDSSRAASGAAAVKHCRFSHPPPAQQNRREPAGGRPIKHPRQS